jgi:uncharacterized protein
MRVVLDTNVLVSAFLFEQRLGNITKLIEQGIIVPCFIVSTLDELKRVLGYKKFESIIENANTSIEEILASLETKSEILADPKIIPDILPDKDFDNYILAAAQAAGAEYLVTGDKLILSLKTFKNIPIIHPQNFLKKF